MTIVDHGLAAMVTCKGTYEGFQSIVMLKFMQVWLKKKSVADRRGRGVKVNVRNSLTSGSLTHYQKLSDFSDRYSAAAVSAADTAAVSAADIAPAHE